MRDFAERLKVTAATTVLDVGGSPQIWSAAPVRPKLAFLNLNAFHETTVIGDGCRLPFRDRAFEIVFSNSVIEHVADPQAFADECRRVGRRYYVQTPNRWFPVEPHLLVPLIHRLPRRIWRALAPLTPRALIQGTHASEIKGLKETRPLSARQLRRLFPDAELVRERWLGMTKALVAVRS